MLKIEHNIDEVADKLGDLIKRYGDLVERDLDKLVFRHANILLTSIVRDWPVDTGVSRAGWRGPERDRSIPGAISWKVVNFVSYAPVIEYGGYRGIGPKTAREGSEVLASGIQKNQGIYPTQKPSAPVRRNLARRTFEIKKDINRLLRS